MTVEFGVKIKNKNKIKNKIEKIKKLFLFQNKKFDLFLVGGAVRDIVLNSEPDDLDFATNATPQEMINFNLTSDFKSVIKTGFDFGTVSFLNTEGELFEITTFRSDINQDGRHTKVNFKTNIIDDLSRRDITINAMAINCFTLELVDTFNGKNDIKNKVIKSVGNPVQRFNEDFLRMLRVLRFAVRFNFKIENQTLIALKNPELQSKLMSIISRERFHKEFIKIMKLKNGNNKFADFIILLKEVDLLKHIFPELHSCIGLTQNKFHNEDVFDHTISVIRNLQIDNNPILTMSALLHDIGKTITKTEINGKVQFIGHELKSADIAENILKRFKFSNSDIKVITTLIKNHMKFKQFGDDMNISKKALRKIIKNKENMSFDLLKELVNADNISHKAEFIMPNQMRILQEKINNEEKLFGTTIKNTSFINGNEIMKAFNVKSGIEVGKIKKKLDELHLEFIELSKEELINILKNNF